MLDRPIVILSGNSVDHGLLALGAMYAGVYYAPIAPAYSLQSGSDFAVATADVASTVGVGADVSDTGG